MHLAQAGTGYVFLPLLLLATAWAQSDSSQASLADLARKTRADKASKDHVAARKVLDEETVPRATWQKQSRDYWATIPPATLTISTPTPIRAAEHGIEIPLKESSIYVPFGETVWSTSFNTAAQEYLSMLLGRSRFRGSALTMDGVEDTTVGGQRAALVHFNFVYKGIQHAGVALFVSAPEQVMSVGCIYRKVDWEQAEPTCEDVINSAEAQVPTEYKPFKKPY